VAVVVRVVVVLVVILDKTVVTAVVALVGIPLTQLAALAQEVRVTQAVLVMD
jgi:hypothetical protein